MPKAETALLQARVTPAVAAWVRERSAAAGWSDAEWLRRLVVAAYEGSRVSAQVMARKDWSLSGTWKPGWTLEWLRDVSATDRVFAIRSYSIPGHPYAAPHHAQMPPGALVRLEGSSNPWVIVWMVLDEGRGRTEVMLRAEPPVTSPDPSP